MIWVLVAYLGYWIGVELARRKYEFPLGEWKQQVEKSTSAFKSSVGSVVKEIKDQIKDRTQAIVAEIDNKASEANKEKAKSAEEKGKENEKGKESPKPD